jgi:hypothetical protein
VGATRVRPHPQPQDSSPSQDLTGPHLTVSANPQAAALAPEAPVHLVGEAIVQAGPAPATRDVIVRDANRAGDLRAVGVVDQLHRQGVQGRLARIFVAKFVRLEVDANCRTRMACTIAVARRGQQCSLARIFQVLRWRSRVRRGRGSFAWAWLTAPHTDVVPVRSWSALGGLSSGRIHRGSAPFSDDRADLAPQLTDGVDHGRTAGRRLGKRLGFTPSRVSNLVSSATLTRQNVQDRTHRVQRRAYRWWYQWCYRQ